MRFLWGGNSVPPLRIRVNYGTHREQKRKVHPMRSDLKMQKLTHSSSSFTMNTTKQNGLHSITNFTRLYTMKLLILSYTPLKPVFSTENMSKTFLFHLKGKISFPEPIFQNPIFNSFG